VTLRLAFPIENLFGHRSSNGRDTRSGSNPARVTGPAGLLTAILFAGSLVKAAVPGQEGMLFSRLNGDARAVALGAAGYGVAEGSAALAANPAGAVLRRELTFGSTYLIWPGDFQGGSLLAMAPVGEGTILAASAFLFAMKPIQETTEEQPDGTGNYAEYVGAEVGLLGAQWFTEDSAVGVNMRILYEDAAGTSAQALGVDVGLLHEFTTAFAGGLSLRGIGRELKAGPVRDQMPFSLVAGGRWAPYESPLRFYAGGEYAPAAPASAGAGIEAGEFAGITVRGGGEWREVGAPAFAAGVGGTSDMWHLDYAFSSAGSAGFAHRISLSLRFARKDAGK